MSLVLAAVACSGPPSAPGGPEGPGRGRLAFEIRDAQSGQPIPARLTLIGAGGSPDPLLADGAVGEVVGRTLLADNTIRTLDGVGEVRVPPGTYDVHVTRGPEWSRVFLSQVVVGAGGGTVRAELAHVVDPAGWLSGDFHVHAEPSYDSDVPLTSRALEFAAEGVELIVATDHNQVTDYGNAIAALHLEDSLASMIGDEVSTDAWGHFGAYPLDATHVGTDYGAQWKSGADGATVIAGVRRDHPGALVQANHPRRGGQGFLTIAGFDRERAAGGEGYSDDFDTLELLNGRDAAHFDDVLADWFALLDHGIVKTAMGNSDSHRLNQLAGYPRTYVRADGPLAVPTALQRHHAFLTTGPIVELSSGGAGIGDVAPARGGTIDVAVRVLAAPWIQVDAATLYVDGVVVKEWVIPPSDRPERLRATETIQVTADAYVVLRADGSEPMGPVVGNEVRGEILPLAVTNPLFVDADGDGKFTR